MCGDGVTPTDKHLLHGVYTRIFLSMSNALDKSISETHTICLMYKSLFNFYSVPIKSIKIASRSPLWRKASSRDIQQYQSELDIILQSCYPTAEMMCDKENSLCLKREHVSKFHDTIMNAAHHAMEKHIPHTGNRKLNVIPG